jgi:uncharacterized protein (DUF2342 family)
MRVRMTPPSELTLGTAVDWRFAATVGQRLARPGPPSSDYTRRQAIDELMTAAAKAEPPVRDVTGLVTEGAVPRPGSSTARSGSARRPSRCA